MDSVKEEADQITTEQEEVASNADINPRTVVASPGVPLCRFCFEGDESKELINPCECSGSQEWVHFECLKQWIESSGKKKCEVCKTKYEGVKMTEKPASFRQFMEHHPSLWNLIVFCILGWFAALHVLFIAYVTLKMASFPGTGLFQSFLIFIFTFLNDVFFVMLILSALAAIVSLILVYRHWAESRLTLKVTGYKKPPEGKKNKKRRSDTAEKEANRGREASTVQTLDQTKESILPAGITSNHPDHSQQHQQQAEDQEEVRLVIQNS